eukprot:SAG31_NODE_1045_length_10180_cov_5.454221_12_plen_88_part_00
MDTNGTGALSQLLFEGRISFTLDVSGLHRPSCDCAPEAYSCDATNVFEASTKCAQCQVADLEVLFHIFYDGCSAQSILGKAVARLLC